MDKALKDVYQFYYMLLGAIPGLIIGISVAIITGLGTNIIISIVGGGMFGATGGMMIGVFYAEFKSNRTIIDNSKITVCKNCGSELKSSNDGKKKICEYCGSVY